MESVKESVGEKGRKMKRREERILCSSETNYCVIDYGKSNLVCLVFDLLFDVFECVICDDTAFDLSCLCVLFCPSRGRYFFVLFAVNTFVGSNLYG